MCLPSAYGAINKKFFKKAADKVWAMKLEDFDAKKQIPDSLLNNSSAVIIAAYDKADINLEKNASSNRTEEAITSRVMVKILDKSALDNFSTFEFVDSKGSTLRLGSVVLSDYKSAFGARVYKPDGRMVDIDISEAYPITSGKKNEQTEGYKIAIPGLEIGDVIDYFYYDENWLDHLSIAPLRFEILHKYPTLSHTITGDIHPDLTIEYRGYNGAPDIQFDAPKNNRRHFEYKIANLPAYESGIGLLPERQNPFIKMFVTNFTAELEYHPSTSRNSGVYRNLMTGTVYRDILTIVRNSKYDSSLPGKVISAAKDFAKQHPEADDYAITDAAWLALNYYDYIDDKNTDSYWLAIMFCDIVKKLNIDKATSVGFLNSRNDVATNQLISWRQPDYLAIVGDRYYLPGMGARIPGELPGDYQGEEGGSFPSNANEVKDMITPNIFTAPTTTVRQNQWAVTSTASIEGNSISLTQRTELSGAQKSVAENAIYFEEWINAVENYLGIAQNKRFTIKSGDKEEHDKERIKYLTQEIAIGPDVTPNVKNVEVSSLGICPDAPNYIYTVDCTIDGLVSEAGNDIIVNIGKLFGDNYVLSDREREHREQEYCADSPSDKRYKVRLNLPDGYTVKEGSLEEILINKSNLAGQFFAQAKYNEADNAIDFSMSERFTRYIVSADYWQDVVAIFDAAATFNSATIVLTRK